MSVQLLDRTRKINKLLHNSSSSKVVFNDICQVLMETLSSNILVLSKKGKVLGVSLCPGVEEITELIEDKVGGYVDSLLNERFLGVLSTKENVNLQTLGFEHVSSSYQGIINPIDIAGERLGYGPLGHNIVNTLGTNLTNRKKYFLEHYGNDFPFDKFLDGYRDAYYELVEDGVPAKKGLHEILKVLREKGLKIGVATSSSEEHAVSNLKREGIFDYFDSVITGNMIEHGKPKPDIYIEACRQLKVDPSKAIALEDAINGIRSAHGAGMNPVMIPDIVQDTSKVDDILFGKCESLLEFAEILQGVTLDIEETQK